MKQNILIIIKKIDFSCDFGPSKTEIIYQNAIRYMNHRDTFYANGENLIHRDWRPAEIKALLHWQIRHFYFIIIFHNLTEYDTHLFTTTLHNLVEHDD